MFMNTTVIFWHNPANSMATCCVHKMLRLLVVRVLKSIDLSVFFASVNQRIIAQIHQTERA